MAAQSRYSSKARKTQNRSHPWRVLGFLLLTVLVLVGGLVFTATHTSSDGVRGSWTPKLGLDLQGGTSITLTARAEGGATIGDDEINQAANIIRQRVDGFGVAEAEVTPQGSGNNRKIVVSLPGEKNEALIDQVRRSAQMRFRLVLQDNSGYGSAGGGSLPEGMTQEDLQKLMQQQNQGATSGTTPTQSNSSSSSTGSSAPKSSGAPGTSATTSGASARSGGGQAVVSGGVVHAHPAVGSTAATADFAPVALRQATTPTSPSSASTSPSNQATSSSPGTTPASGAATTPLAAPKSVEQQYQELDCLNADQNNQLRRIDDPNQQIAACGIDQKGRPDGTKYLLDKAVLIGSDIQEASATLRQNQQGMATGGWQVNITFKSDAARKWSEFTKNTIDKKTAIVLDGQVISDPVTKSQIPDGQMMITNDSQPFTKEYAQNLANYLKYGALPLSFDAGQIQEISPTLGTKQLQAGLLAGLIGLILVILYSLLYYRLLGMVNVVSLVISMGLTYLVVTLMSNLMGLRLSLPGVAGLVIGIGIAADSFVVYFERLRDELRSGKTLRVAAEVAWKRARRTIVAADFVSFLAAVVLYILSIGSVRGFAVMLGLSTIIDIVVVFLFTKPVVSLLARTSYFSQRRRLSGLADTGQQRPGEQSDATFVKAGRPARQGA